MATTLRSTVRSAIASGAAIVKWSWKEFAQMASGQGYVNYVEMLDRDPALGKFPFIAFNNPVNNESVTVMVGTELGKMIRANTFPVEALKTLTIIDGLNGKLEPRYYLSRNGITEITVEEAIAHADAYVAKQIKMSAERLQKIIAGV